MTSPAVLRAEGLTKVSRTGEVEVHALRGVDLALGAGELIVLLGPSSWNETPAGSPALTTKKAILLS